MTKTITTCDDCGKEVEGVLNLENSPHDLTQVDSESIKLVCEDCLKEYDTNLIN